jgi:regulator of cell morphogenesis and NO signaling
MNMQEYKIDINSYISDIVAHDYRTAEVFRKHDIDFYCSGKWSLDEACKEKGIDTEEILKELKHTIKSALSGNNPEFDKWDIDFLADYILNIHHRFLNKALPEAFESVKRMLGEQGIGYSELKELETILQRMMKEIPPHMKKEEEVIFPYIKQINHAWRHKDSYASLLIRTLRKPVEEVMQAEHESVGKQLQKIREITNKFTVPSHSSSIYRVTFAKLKELENDLVQHIHLENNILFPKAIALEKELLLNKD